MDLARQDKASSPAIDATISVLRYPMYRLRTGLARNMCEVRCKQTRDFAR